MFRSFLNALPLITIALTLGCTKRSVPNDYELRMREVTLLDNHFVRLTYTRDFMIKGVPGTDDIYVPPECTDGLKALPIGTVIHIPLYTLKATGEVDVPNNGCIFLITAKQKGNQ